MTDYFAGWDGGGTKTLCEARTAENLVLARFTAGPLNPNGAAADEAESTTAAMLAQMAQLPGGLSGCQMLCIAAAGISNPATAHRLRAALDRGGYEGRVVFTGDQRAALYGALGGPVGAILIAGTGSICYGQTPDGREARAGGWGSLMDDGGSGYALGRDILAAVVRSEDGRGPKTTLRGPVFHAWGVSDVRGLIGAVYAPGVGKREIAALAPLLNQALEGGDTAALDIRDRAVEELAALVRPVVETLGLEQGRLALMGGVLTRCTPIRAELEARLAARYPKLTCQPPEQDAAAGAALLAFQSMGRYACIDDTGAPKIV